MGINQHLADTLTFSSFAEKYDMTVNNIYMALENKLFTRAIIKDNRLPINYFERRVEFNKNVQLFNQDMYYYLTEFYSVTHISKVVKDIYGVSINQYLHDYLFRPQKEGIFKYTVTQPALVFYRYGKSVERKLLQKNPKFNLTKILDRRMM